MELLIITLLFIALGVAAIRWGHDSRDVLHSPEERLACHGYSWQPPATN